jgi:ABC-type uncharacterized transport system fused permease/ATPase subunit
MDKLGDKTGQIERIAASDGKLTFDNLGVASPTGCTTLSESHVVIAPGERVLIVGAPEVGKTSAIAGLWPWGRGRILLPPRETMFFMSQPPYIPPGSLRTVLSYPAPPKLDRLRAGRPNSAAMSSKISLSRVNLKVARPDAEPHNVLPASRARVL